MLKILSLIAKRKTPGILVTPLSACFQIMITLFVFMKHFDHTICERS